MCALSACQTGSCWRDEGSEPAVHISHPTASEDFHIPPVASEFAAVQVGLHVLRADRMKMQWHEHTAHREAILSGRVP